VDTGLLILRIVFGGLNCFGRGAKKLFRWFSGHSLDGTGGFFHSLGFRPGKRMAAVAGLSEVGPGRRPAGCARPCTGSLPAFRSRLAPRGDPDHVLGWKVLQNTPTKIALGVDSSIGVTARLIAPAKRWRAILRLKQIPSQLRSRRREPARLLGDHFGTTRYAPW
jgi:hypothetical protein